MPLNLAIKWGNLKLVKTLVENGADINLNQEGMAPALCDAVFYDCRPIMDYLIDNGADLNIISKPYIGYKMEISPLIVAVKYYYLDNVKYLLGKGANINIFVIYHYFSKTFINI